LLHDETLAYMSHQLPLDRKLPQARTAHRQTQPVMPGMIDIPAGAATLGLPRDGERFGWDNEYEAHTVTVPAFAIDKYKVTNRQYLEFLNAGGYDTRALWSDEDWNWEATDYSVKQTLLERAGQRSLRV